eukprot:scaffold15557_cov73-Skeletonema_marinoi.AAC.1
MESAGSNVVDFCAAVSDAQMTETSGVPMNGTYSSCRATQTDVIDTDDNCTNQQPLSTSPDGATGELPTNDSLDTSLDVNDASGNTNTNDTTSAMDTNNDNDPATTTQNRWVKPQPLILDKTTSSEDILLNALPSLNINSSSSMVSPSSILSDSTVDDIKSPTSSSELIDFHPDHHHHHLHNNNNHEAQAMAQNLASEHKIFLRAALDMLTERDQLRMYADVNDPNNIIKTGTLRKASHRIKGVWRTKHVEIREGVFSYLSGSANKSSSSRKDVLLRASS